MSSSGTANRRLFLLLCLLIVLPLSGCSGGTKPSGAPAATASHESADLDLKPLLRDFLKNLPADWNLMSAQDVANAKPFVVDVRQPDEYARGFIEGAVNLPLRELALSLQAMPAMDKDIVLVCGRGDRSAIGMVVLQMLGYRKARSLEGGMRGWQQARLPVAAAPVTRRPAGQAPKVNARLQAMLDYYLVHTLPLDWGTISPSGLTEDQHRKSSAELEPQPETFDQGRSVLVDVDGPEEFAKAGLSKAIDAPLRTLPDELDSMPLEETIHWA